MSELEHGGIELNRIHKTSNYNKIYCHFTGFLKGIIASGHIEKSEFEPLIAECEEFVRLISDGDANDIIEDFYANLLEKQSLHDAVDVRKTNIDPICKKNDLNLFLGYCKGIVCDGKTTLSEITGIIEQLENNDKLLENKNIHQIYVLCIDAVEDHIIDASEERQICDAIGAVVGASYSDTGITQTHGIANYTEYTIGDAQELKEAVVVLTGKFSVRPRSKLEDELRNIGTTVNRHVSTKTDFIIIGGTASRDWLEMNRGTKLMKAQELHIKTERPNFVSEHQILGLLGTSFT